MVRPRRQAQAVPELREQAVSRASELARRLPKDIHIRQMGSPYACMIYMVNVNGVPAMWIDNAGPFNKRESMKLARWILDTFEEKP